MKDNFISKIKAHFLMKRVLKNRKRVGKTYSRLIAYFLSSILSWEYNDESDIRDLKEMLNCYDANIKEAELILLSNYRNRIKRHESSKTVKCNPDQSIAEQVKEFRDARKNEKDKIKEEAQKPSDAMMYSCGYSNGYAHGFKSGKIELIDELIQTFYEMRDSTTGIEIDSVIKIFEQRKIDVRGKE